MRTHEALQLIELHQKNLCKIGQSVVRRGKQKFDAEIIDLVKTKTEELILDLGTIRQEIYRFIQDNKKLKVNCQYNIDSPISNGLHDGDIKGVQNHLVKTLGEIKKDIVEMSIDTMISGSDNRRYNPTTEFKEAVKKFSTGIGELVDKIMSQQHEGITAEPIKQEELTVEEKKTETTTISETLEDGTSSATEEEENKEVVTQNEGQVVPPAEHE